MHPSRQSMGAMQHEQTDLAQLGRISSRPGDVLIDIACVDT
jgi:hypothetical protein